MVAARCLSLTFGPSSLIYQPIGRYLTEAEGRCYLSDITRIMVRVGQSEWDDIKILGHQMGHLISKFQAIWDTCLTCQVQIPSPV